MKKEKPSLPNSPETGRPSRQNLTNFELEILQQRKTATEGQHDEAVRELEELKTLLNELQQKLQSLRRRLQKRPWLTRVRLRLRQGPTMRHLNELSQEEQDVLDEIRVLEDDLTQIRQELNHLNSIFPYEEAA